LIARLNDEGEFAGTLSRQKRLVPGKRDKLQGILPSDLHNQSAYKKVVARDGNTSRDAVHEALSHRLSRDPEIHKRRQPLACNADADSDDRVDQS